MNCRSFSPASLIFFFFCAIGLTAHAQPVSAPAGNRPPQKAYTREATPEEHAKMQVNRLSKTLGLSQAQYDRVYEIKVAHLRKAEEARAQADAARKGFKAERTTITAESDARILAALDENQQVKYRRFIVDREAKKAERHADMRNHPGE